VNVQLYSPTVALPPDSLVAIPTTRAFPRPTDTTDKQRTAAKFQLVFGFQRFPVSFGILRNQGF
jgi:hypothetical protein